MRTAQLHLQRSTETLLGYLHGITGKDHQIANRAQPRMWHSRPGCDFAPPGASKSAPQAGTPFYLSLGTHPAYGLIDMATRQLHGDLHDIRNRAKIRKVQNG